MSATVSIRDKRVLTTREVIDLIGEQTMRDAVAAGWLAPCATKENPRQNRPIYSMRDVEAVEARIVGGEYPEGRLACPFATGSQGGRPKLTLLSTAAESTERESKQNTPTQTQ